MEVLKAWLLLSPFSSPPHCLKTEWCSCALQPAKRNAHGTFGAVERELVFDVVRYQRWVLFLLLSCQNHAAFNEITTRTSLAREAHDFDPSGATQH